MPRASASVAHIHVGYAIIALAPDKPVIAILLIGGRLAAGGDGAIVGDWDVQVQIAFMREIARQFQQHQQLQYYHLIYKFVR